MVLKPSEKAVHSGEDLAPVPESFWSHSYVFYPGILEGNMHQIPLVASCERVARADLHHVKQPHWVRGGGEIEEPVPGPGKGGCTLARRGGTEKPRQGLESAAPGVLSTGCHKARWGPVTTLGCCVTAPHSRRGGYRHQCWGGGGFPGSQAQWSMSRMRSKCLLRVAGRSSFNTLQSRE